MNTPMDGLITYELNGTPLMTELAIWGTYMNDTKMISDSQSDEMNVYKCPFFQRLPILQTEE